MWQRGTFTVEVTFDKPKTQKEIKEAEKKIKEALMGTGRALRHTYTVMDVKKVDCRMLHHD
jgi:2-keto-3-deoxy-6-phosphogluconate aldolase